LGGFPPFTARSKNLTLPSIRHILAGQVTGWSLKGTIGDLKEKIRKFILLA
jgi:hypothetical protein